MIRKFYSLLISLRVAVWLTGIVLAFMAYGAFILPKEEVFQAMSSEALFKWLMKAPPAYSFWLWGTILALVLLAVNTIFCSVDSIIKKKNTFLLMLAPQVIHIGFLFMLLAHLLSSLGAYKIGGGLPEGMTARLPNGDAFRLTRIEAVPSPEGHIMDFKAQIEHIRNGRLVKRGELGPNKPSFYGGLGFYLKDLRLGPYPMALIEVSHEPGALWALIGAILFTAGTVALVILKMRRE
jgi:hypothetical protein